MKTGVAKKKGSKPLKLEKGVISIGFLSLRVKLYEMRINGCRVNFRTILEG